MIVHIVAAMDPKRVIGKDNTLPWNYPEDLKHFREVTSGKVIVMGYKTHLSIGRILPKRRNIILSSQAREGLECYTNISDMMQKLRSEGVQELFVIWGATIYQQFLDADLVDFIDITCIKKEYPGDTYFPVFEDKFVEVERKIFEEMDFVKYAKRPMI